MAFFQRLADPYHDMWESVIRPPREKYDLKQLGPQSFTMGDWVYRRTDLTLTVSGLQLHCSHFEPVDSERIAEKLPCVIYLHGNRSCRLEALPAVSLLLPQNITLFCYDSRSCGLSEGEYISLGWFERQDLRVIVEYLRSSGSVSWVGLWGRSMGAVTALMYAELDPSIGGMVLDSPFTSLSVLIEEVAKSQALIPRLLVSPGIGLLRKIVSYKADFDIKDVDPLKSVANCKVPALFAAGNYDVLVRPHHAVTLHDQFPGEKQLIFINGDHNSPRPDSFHDTVASFFSLKLHCNVLPRYKMVQAPLPKDSDDTMELEELPKQESVEQWAEELQDLALQESLERTHSQNFFAYRQLFSTVPR